METSTQGNAPMSHEQLLKCCTVCADAPADAPKHSRPSELHTQTVYKSWQVQPEALCCLCLLVAGGGRELLVDSEVFNGDISTNGFSNKSWPAGLHVQDFFWGELVLSEGAPFECLTPDGRAKVCESLAGCQTNAAECSCDQVASCTHGSQGGVLPQYRWVPGAVSSLMRLQDDWD